MTKNFALFIVASYYPSGGWNDLYDTYETHTEAQAEGLEYLKENGWGYGFHIVDLHNGRIIEEQWAEVE